MKTAIFTLLAFLALESGASATNSELLSFVSPDSKVIAGLQVEQIKSSPFGVYLLAHFQPTDAGFTNFVQATGFDPRRDVSEMVLASNWQNSTPDSRWLVTAKGNFDALKITNALKAAGATLLPGTNIYILTSANPNGSTQLGVVFLDNNSTAVIGDVASVQAALQRKQSNATPDAGLLTKISAVSDRQFWFATLVPLSAFAGAMPDPNLQGAMQGNMLQGISQAVGGINFAQQGGATLDAQATTRSDKDGQALVDVIHFVAGLIQQNKTSSPAAGQVSSILDNLTASANGNVVSLHVPISETQLEALLQNTPGTPQPRRRTRVQ